ncbi:FadR/GntR family transcriptional regulator [Acuticoccus kandeliae]|uniref:FadR/GntR family transcriptional regulator n=1 Tax=Acuticoccus kandeliae TaxID=2073160 RepID=UPI000D3E8F95|nr:FCD domain-containing protein [Acuticoccus kandeliae]
MPQDPLGAPAPFPWSASVSGLPLPAHAGGGKISKNADLHPFAQRLINEIVWKICRNELHPGEQLPSIEEMARIYDVGRSTIREAIRYIESTGLVYSAHGRGTFVLDFNDSEGGIAFIDEIVDMRKMIELHATQLAVHHRSEAHLERMNTLLDEMRRTTAHFQYFIDVDRAFHGTIVDAAGNAFLPSIFRNISGVYNAMQNALIYLDPKVTDASIVHHQQILDAIAARDEALALQYTDDHLSMISRLFRASLG